MGQVQPQAAPSGPSLCLGPLVWPGPHPSTPVHTPAHGVGGSPWGNAPSFLPRRAGRLREPLLGELEEAPFSLLRDPWCPPWWPDTPASLRGGEPKRSMPITLPTARLQPLPNEERARELRELAKMEGGTERPPAPQSLSHFQTSTRQTSVWLASAGRCHLAWEKPPFEDQGRHPVDGASVPSWTADPPLCGGWLGPLATLSVPPTPTGSGTALPITCEFQAFLAGTGAGAFWNSTVFFSAPNQAPSPPARASPTLPGPASSCHPLCPGSTNPPRAGEPPPRCPVCASRSESKAPSLPRGPDDILHRRQRH